MSLLTVLGLAFGLAMDAAAVSLARGFAAERVSPGDVARTAGLFGAAHVLMPLAGAGLGKALGMWIAAWDHWVAFILLSGIGGKMIWEAWRSTAKSKGDHPGRPLAAGPSADPFGTRTLLALAFATSLDALAVGVTLPLLDAPLAVSVLCMGAVAAGLTALGLVLGRRFGSALGRRLDALGGLALVVIGLRNLLEHLAGP